MNEQRIPSGFSKKPVTSTYDAVTPLLRSRGRQLTNVPAQPTPLIGRESETEAIRALLLDPNVRLVTLTGPGGVGKTRLALEIALCVLEKFPHKFPEGTYFVSLGSITDAHQVLSTIAAQLKIREEAEKALNEVLKTALRGSTVLIVLDNFEQVLSAATYVSELLASCSRIKILVTSRAPLRIRGEFEFPVPVLEVPDPTKFKSTERLLSCGSIRLFSERAKAVKPDFRVTDENATLVAEICLRLEGLPLALELAAVRIKTLHPKELLNRLQERLKVLTEGPQDAPPRQRTLRNAIGWSYDLLQHAEQKLFRHLAVFNGGFTLDTANAVCPEMEDILEDLSSLVDNSLIRREDIRGSTRYFMLETIREFALESLMSSGEENTVRQMHADRFLSMAEEASCELRGPEQIKWLDRLDHEIGNIRAALTWYIKNAKLDSALQLSGALWHFWVTRGYLVEGRDWLVTVLSRTKECTAPRARALRGAGVLAEFQGNYSAAKSLYEDSLMCYRMLKDELGVSTVLSDLGCLALELAQYTEARGLFEQSLELKNRFDDTLGAATVLSNLGKVAELEGKYSKARDMYEQSLTVKRRMGDTYGISASLIDLASLLRREGDFSSARQLYSEGLQLNRELNDRLLIALCLEGLATLLCAEGQHERAVQIFAKAEALIDSVGPSSLPIERKGYEQSLAVARSALADDVFQTAWSSGYSKSLDEIVSLVERRADN